jgi:hypothetical protein
MSLCLGLDQSTCPPILAFLDKIIRLHHSTCPPILAFRDAIFESTNYICICAALLMTFKLRRFLDFMSRMRKTNSNI